MASRLFGLRQSAVIFRDLPRLQSSRAAALFNIAWRCDKIVRWISAFLWVHSEFYYDNMNRQPICKEKQMVCYCSSDYLYPLEHRFHHLCWYSNATRFSHQRCGHDSRRALLHEAPKSKRQRRWCPMTHRLLSCLGVKLIETNGFDSWKKREQKVTFPFQIRASAFFAACFSDLKNYRIAPFPISPTTVGPDCCWRLQQLPQGCQSSLGYNSLSGNSCNSAKAITTFLSEIPPKVLSSKPSSGSSFCFLVAD